MDLLAKGSRWLAEKQEAFCSSDIIYVHDGEQFLLSATFGRTEYEIADEYGVKTGAHVVDFIIRATLLPFDPEPGDTILVGDFTYEVMSLGQNGCWQWCDTYHHLRRIHTKQI